MARDEVSVYAPATVGNVGPGYDVLGLALEAPGDTLRARRTDRPGVRLLRVTGEFALPPADERNTACVAARLTLERLGSPFGLELELHKGLPIGSGMGSSGASAAAAATAANLLAGAPLLPEQLVSACAGAEAAACGAAHADNVAPALLGGVTIVRGPEDVSRVPTGLDLALALVSPADPLPTRRAREAIPGAIPTGEVIHNMAQVASLVLALTTDDAGLLRRALSDRIAEPRRAPLVPGFAEVKRAALEAGALGASLSGAGPTTFGLCLGREAAAAAADAMSAALDVLGIHHARRVAGLGRRGAREQRP
jgi:homoserine kinase